MLYSLVETINHHYAFFLRRLWWWCMNKHRKNPNKLLFLVDNFQVFLLHIFHISICIYADLYVTSNRCIYMCAENEMQINFMTAKQQFIQFSCLPLISQRSIHSFKYITTTHTCTYTRCLSHFITRVIFTWKIHLIYKSILCALRFDIQFSFRIVL